MGMYTELNISVDIKADINTLKVLKFMLGTGGDISEFVLPDHILFKISNRWRFMLTSDSFSFPHTADSSLRNKVTWEDDSDKPIKERTLNVRCDFKNYANELEQFLDWIYPFTTTRGFIGCMRYEEDRNPKLIYFAEDGIHFIPTDNLVNAFLEGDKNETY